MAAFAGFGGPATFETSQMARITKTATAILDAPNTSPIRIGSMYTHVGSTAKITRTPPFVSSIASFRGADCGEPYSRIGPVGVIPDHCRYKDGECSSPQSEPRDDAYSRRRHGFVVVSVVRYWASSRSTSARQVSLEGSPSGPMIEASCTIPASGAVSS